MVLLKRGGMLINLKIIGWMYKETWIDNKFENKFKNKNKFCFDKNG